MSTIPSKSKGKLFLYRFFTVKMNSKSNLSFTIVWSFFIESTLYISSIPSIIWVPKTSLKHLSEGCSLTLEIDWWAVLLKGTALCWIIFLHNKTNPTKAELLELFDRIFYWFIDFFLQTKFLNLLNFEYEDLIERVKWKKDSGLLIITHQFKVDQGFPKTGATQMFKVKGAKWFQTEAIVANILKSPKIWVKWSDFPNIDGAFAPSATPLHRPWKR